MTKKDEYTEDMLINDYKHQPREKQIEIITSIMKKHAEIKQDSLNLNRGWYITDGKIDIFYYLFSDGTVNFTVVEKPNGATAFWPTKKQAQDFYNNWKKT